MTALEIISKLDFNQVESFASSKYVANIKFYCCDDFLRIEFLSGIDSVIISFKSLRYRQNNVTDKIKEYLQRIKEKIQHRDEQFLINNFLL